MTKINIKNSTIHLSIHYSNNEDAVKKEIKEFDLSNSTPIDCMGFIRKLKQLIGG